MVNVVLLYVMDLLGILAIFLREAIQEDIEGHILAPDDDFTYKTKRRK